LVNKNPLNIDNVDIIYIIKDIQNKFSLQEPFNDKINLKPLLKAGDDYFPFKANKFGKDEEVFLNFENGVSVIIYWDERANICQSMMKEYFEKIEKNFNKWNGKVKFFTTCFSRPQFKEEHVKIFAENNWNNFLEIIQHFYTYDLSLRKDILNLPL